MMRSATHRAIRKRSVHTIAIRDRSDNVVHTFTTLANQHEVVDIVMGWLKPLEDAGLGEGYSWSYETDNADKQDSADKQDKA